MMLYLIRHAHAVDAEDDDTRVLSKRGREQVHTLVAFLKSNAAFEPAEIWHSPLLRAHETAERLKDGLKLHVPLLEMSGLRPEDPPEKMAPKLGALRHAVAVVGHEPHLSGLASVLVTGKTEPVGFVFKKGTVLALEGAGHHWAVRWQIAPELLQ
jgi:phosphohistidine phosphatase